MKEKIKQFVGGLLDLSFELKEKGHDLYIDWSPNINNISIYLYKFGFSVDKEFEYEKSIYIRDSKIQIYNFCGKNVTKEITINDIKEEIIIILRKAYKERYENEDTNN